MFHTTLSCAASCLPRRLSLSIVFRLVGPRLCTTLARVRERQGRRKLCVAHGVGGGGGGLVRFLLLRVPAWRHSCLLWVSNWSYLLAGCLIRPLLLSTQKGVGIVLVRGGDEKSFKLVVPDGETGVSAAVSKGLGSRQYAAVVFCHMQGVDDNCVPITLIVPVVVARAI